MAISTRGLEAPAAGIEMGAVKDAAGLPAMLTLPASGIG